LAQGESYMGSKYSSQAVSGFDSSPPVDDGSATEANKVKWSTIQTKLASPLKTHAEAINTALVTALDQSCRTVSANDAASASDHDRTIQVTTSSVTITLADATTMAAGYVVSVANASSGNITVALATATDTIDSTTNATQIIHAKDTKRYIVNAAATGYLTASETKSGAYKTTQVFTSDGTWTKPAGLKRVKVIVVGSGAGSGGVALTGAGETAAAGGGGAGGAAIKTIEAASLGATETVTVGAAGAAGAAGNNSGGNGNTSSFGTHASATGGTGGSGGANLATTGTGGQGGAGGVGSDGDINIEGEGGGTGLNFGGDADNCLGGKGGSSIMGGGGHPIATTTNTEGTPGGNYGAGASGAARGANQAAGAGSAGAGGIVIVEEFF
jgi:hypothetical protein